MQGVDLGETRLPTSTAIASLRPDGALVGGQSYQLAGSTALRQAALAGAWCAVVGMPDLPTRRSRFVRHVHVNRVNDRVRLIRRDTPCLSLEGSQRGGIPQSTADL